MKVTRKALRNYYPDGRWTRRVLPLPEYNCVYVRNAKAATSTVLLWLHRIHTGDYDANPGRIHENHGLPTPGEVGRADVARMLSGEAFRFTFVRDPIRRAESAYRSKVVDAWQDRWRAELRQALGVGEDQPLTFDLYVDALEAMEPISMDTHFRPQHLNLMHPLVEYDLIGRLESFNEDLARIREAVGFPDVPMEHRNRTERTESLFDGRLDLRRRVEAVYARDFELYGY